MRQNTDTREERVIFGCGFFVWSRTSATALWLSSVLLRILSVSLKKAAQREPAKEQVDKVQVRNGWFTRFYP